MRSDAKASSAGSTQGRGRRSGSFVRGADATRAPLSSVDGSGAPSHRARVVALSLATALLALALFASPALASKEVISEFGTFAGSGSHGGEFNNPRNVGVNETGAGAGAAGDTYVADEANNRIERFDSKGNFISAWGKDVIVASVNERQRIIVQATSGTYTLSFDGSTTTPIQFNLPPQSNLAALPTVNGSANVEVSGEGTVTDPFIVTFTGALGGANQPTIIADTSELSGTVEISTIANGKSNVANDTGTGFEICTVAAECKAGTASGENGALDHPQSVAVDQDTGNVYVSDRDNRRIEEYDGEGNFIRSFGFDVAESGPGDTGIGYEVCDEADGDACKAGEAGAGAGQYGEGFAENGFGIAVSPADGNGSTGTVYLADSGNRRVGTYDLDGGNPASFGTSAQFGEGQPRSVAVDSRGIVYASDSSDSGDIQRYDSEDANGGGVGFLAPILSPHDERQEITFTGFTDGDNFTLTCPDGTPTEELTYSTGFAFGIGSIGLSIIKNGLEAACGADNFSFSGEPPSVTVTFNGAFAAANQPQMTCTTLSGSGSCSVSTTSEGHSGPLLPGEASSATAGLAVDPNTDTLYVLRDPSTAPTVVQQFGPVNEPGLTVAPTVTDETHGEAAGFSSVRGFGFDSTSGRFYVSANNDPDGFHGPLTSAHRVYVLADSSSLPRPTSRMIFTGSITAITDRSATFHGLVDPQGGLVDCKFQYSTDEIHWADLGTAEGTGNVSGTRITNVTTTSGAFAAGQRISGSGLPGGMRIVAVDGKTLTLSFPASFDSNNVALSATPAFPPSCDSLNLNGGEQNISQKDSGLVPGTHYFARLQVTRPYFSNFTPAYSVDRVNFTTTSGSPVVSGAMASAVDEHSVRVTATIDPSHSPTSYVVQYGATPSLGSTTAPVQIGEGSTSIDISPVIAGLSSATQYYFKLVATNPSGSTESKGLVVATFPSPSSFASCSNNLLRTGPSARLPDCRAYEQATPTDKYGSDAYGDTFGVQASRAGDAITSFAYAGFPGGEAFQDVNVLLSRFAAGEWSTAGLNPSQSYGDRAKVLASTPDLSLSFARARSTDGSPGSKLVMRDSADGSRTLLIPQGVGFNDTVFNLGGAFDSDSKVVFEARGAAPITSGPAPLSIARNVYLYDRDSGEFTLAGLLPDSACGSPPCVPAEGSRLPAAYSLDGSDGFVMDGHVVSSSGDVYFTDAGTGQLYLRSDTAGPGASTVQVSASERTDCADHDPCNGTPEPDPAGTFEPTFMGATPDGAYAFFKSQQKLTDNSTSAAGAEDLYRYDAGAPEGQRLTDLAPGTKTVGMLGYSDDGSRAYFAANADLDGPGPAAPGNCGSFVDSPSCAVYLWQADGTGSCASAGGCVTFVARVDARFGGSLNWTGASIQGPTFSGMKTSRVSSDGRVLVFQTAKQLTAYDNTPAAGATCSGADGRCAEFYRFNAESGQIDCLSCNPTGAPPTRAPDLKNPNMYHAPSSNSTYGAQPFLSRNLSSDGNRFFFQSTDKLVPADVNGEVSCSEKEIAQLGAGPSCRDVYEWEAAGTGSCTTQSGAYSPANGGCIYLLSTGTGAFPSYLADVSESGDTAFIFSRQQLVPSDEDAQEDIYAVKVNGGLAYQHAARPAACEGDACRGASSRPSDAPGAGSGVFEGPGNPKSGTNNTRCPKGKRQVRSKGKVRCVAKHKKRNNRKRAANNDRRASR